MILKSINKNLKYKILLYPIITNLSNLPNTLSTTLFPQPNFKTPLLKKIQGHNLKNHFVISSKGN